MAQFAHSFSMEDALARNNEVYELEFDRWGERNAAPGVNPSEVNLQWPPPGSRPIPSSMAAVAIGPRSTVDRCWISWDRQKILNIPPADVLLPDAVVNVPRIITRDAPLLFPQTTAREPTLNPAMQSWWDAMQFGIAYVFPWGPRPGFNDLVQGLGSSGHGGAYGTTTGSFAGQTYVNMFGVSEVFLAEMPFLHLMLYAKLPSFSPPTKRASMLRERTVQLGAGTGNVLAARYPIFGRKHVGISLMSNAAFGSPAQTADYRIGLIRNVNENPIGSDSPVFEVKAFEALAVPGNTPLNIQLDNPCADYLSIYVTNGALGPIGVALTTVAED